MSQSRIVATGRILPIVEEILRPYASVEVASATDEDSLIAMSQGMIGLIVRGLTPISRKVIESARELRVIGRTGVGYENVDIAAASERGIPVVFTPGAGSKAVAEGTLMMLLALAKRLRELDLKTRGGDWRSRDSVPIGDLYGATIGIIGLGRIGTEVARLARAFDMNVCGYDPVLTADAGERIGVRLVSLETLLGSSDFITIHAPLTEKTHGLLDADRMELVKPGAILVNLARGPLLADLDVLESALDSGRLSGLGLDVYPIEPPDVSHPIFRRANVLCTPHCMGLSLKASAATFTMVGQGMAEVLSGGRPENVVNPEAFNGFVRDKGSAAQTPGRRLA